MNNKLQEIFIYCPRCRNKLYSKGPRLIDCPKCGFHFYWNASPTVGAILENKKGEILLVERKGDPKKGYWDIPGGFIEADETFEEGLTRELKEELGVNIGVMTYIGSSIDLYDYKGISYNTIVAVYTGIIEDKIIPSDDVASVRFFPKQSFPRSRFSFPGLAKLIEKYIGNKEK